MHSATVSEKIQCMYKQIKLIRNWPQVAGLCSTVETASRNDELVFSGTILSILQYNYISVVLFSNHINGAAN